MKKFNSIRNLGFLIILIVMTNLYSTKSKACVASFTWSQTSNNVITFTNTSTGTTINTTYVWWFGDGIDTVYQNPVHTYLIPGNYTVNFEIHDTSGCYDSITVNITVTGVVICNLVAYATEYSMTSCGTCPNGYAYATNTGGTSPYTYVWQTIPIQTTDMAAGLLPGTYTVCITDANACSSCASVTIDTCALQVNFSWMQTSNNVISFTNLSTDTTYTYFNWTFGDTYNTNIQNPVHTYNNPGTYTVCLHAENSYYCVDSICQTITVTGVNCFTFAITTSSTSATCDTCANGIVFANAFNGTPPYTYSWNPNVSSTYFASGLNYGNYQVCVTDAFGCSACNTVWVDSTTDPCSANFTLFPDTTQLHHYIAINNATGIQPIHYLWNWGDGNTDSIPLPSHVYSDSGVYTICLTITDSIGCQSTFCDSNYHIMRTSNYMTYVNVIAHSTGIPSIQKLNNFSVYPNPVGDNMTVNYYLSSSSTVVINLYDMLGNNIRQVENDKQTVGEHTLSVNTSTLSEGIYLLQINTDNKVYNKKISVIK
jgi:PKD repeat protein